MRLIDADALERKIAEHKAQETMGLITVERRFAYEWTKSDMYGLVKNAPTIEAEPVRHGRWVMMAGFPACSECGCSPADWEAKPDNPEGNPPYCHSCGAKMDGGAEG